ncbi:hypothetical protein [Agrobacterium vitis]|uniref:hypothetical protein n=1 Tax=Agrobacterium vitis TaxID=373 RepID=UPI003D29F7AA
MSHKAQRLTSGGFHQQEKRQTAGPDISSPREWPSSSRWICLFDHVSQVTLSLKSLEVHQTAPRQSLPTMNGFYCVQPMSERRGMENWGFVTKFGRFLIDRLVLWIVIAMISAILAIVLMLPPQNTQYEPPASDAPLGGPADKLNDPPRSGI